MDKAESIARGILKAIKDALAQYPDPEPEGYDQDTCAMDAVSKFLRECLLIIFLPTAWIERGSSIEEIHDQRLREECADRAIKYGLKSGMFKKPDCEYTQGIRRAIENEHG